MPLPNRPATGILVEDEALLRKELRNQLATLWPDLHIAAEAGDGVEALRAINQHQPDIVFLDIRIPGMNGLEVAARVSKRTHVVFVTAHQEYAVSAFEQGAIDYVVKPLDPARLATTVARLKLRMSHDPPDLTGLIAQLRESQPVEWVRWIQASVGDKIRIIPAEEVAYFQSEAKYTKVASDRGDLHIRRTIKELVGELDPKLFWQVNRGIIVNLARVEEVLRNGETLSVRMRGRPERLPVSQPFHHLFRRT
jgi:DNA-binding LytR/AlgR family response regulator